MEKILWYIIIPLIVFASYFLAVLTLKESFRNALGKYIKNSFWRKCVIVYSRLFTLFSVVLYFITLNEGFENKHLGELTVSNFFRNFFETIGYFFGWIMFYWVFFLFVASAIIAIIWALLRKLIPSKTI
jgi:hypothetical protein